MNTIDTAALLSATPYKESDKHDLAEHPEKLAPFLTYADRDSYLAFVAEWKSVYRNLSAEIRIQKRDWRAAGSDIPYPLQRARNDSRRLARTLLALRAAAKVDSWGKHQAQRAVSAEAVA